jgi:hypothetical protein
LPLHTELCQKELAVFADHAQRDVLVACTQEARLFGEVADDANHSGKVQSIRFVNIRETAGWSTQARAATPKIAALLALAGLPEPEPVSRIAFKSEGQLLIAGPAELALAWADRLQSQLAVSVLIADCSRSPLVAPNRIHQPRGEQHFHEKRLQVAHACARLGRAELPGRPEHGAQEDCGRDAARNLPKDVARHAAPRKLSSHSEGDCDGRIEMRPAYRSHEVDDGHDHKAGPLRPCPT